MSGRDPDAPIPADFRCDYAPAGERACPAWRCDCFVATHPDSPFDLHPEDFTVVWREPPPGWVAFGALIDYDGPTECSKEVGRDGLPLWERVMPERDDDGR